ncbi:hypothetical protein [Arthrobacter sp. AQ5-05]|uniref:hypothetical protein n=1 Tax=Arthrobacter sp. AQ5-05 TaxID=2184581 RepID=UPI0015EB7794|nr:hypothetical protein [Arthrobacter sp. AQ5-05]
MMLIQRGSKSIGGLGEILGWGISGRVTASTTPKEACPRSTGSCSFSSGESGQGRSRERQILGARHDLFDVFVDHVGPRASTAVPSLPGPEAAGSMVREVAAGLDAAVSRFRPESELLRDQPSLAAVPVSPRSMHRMVARLF